MSFGGAPKKAGGPQTPDAPVDPLRPLKELSAEEEAVVNEKALEGLTSARDAIDVLIRGDHVPKDYKVIAARIRGSIHPDTKIVLVSPGDKVPNGLRGAKGSFWSGPKDPGTVYLKRGVFGDDHGVSTETILHELLHAATMQKLRIGNQSANVNTPVGKATKNLFDLQNRVVKHFNDYHAANPGLDHPLKQYQMSSVDELISYGFTDRRFQDFLRSIPSGVQKGKTLWSEFVEDILAILGIPEKERSALDELLDLTDKLLDAPPARDYRIIDTTGMGVAARATSPLEKAQKALSAAEEVLAAARKKLDGRDGYERSATLEKRYALLNAAEEAAKSKYDAELERLASQTVTDEKRAKLAEKIEKEYAAEQARIEKQWSDYDAAQEREYDAFDRKAKVEEDLSQKRVDAAKAAYKAEIDKTREAEKARLAAAADTKVRIDAKKAELAAAQAAYDSLPKTDVKPREGLLGVEQASQARKRIDVARQKVDDLDAEIAEMETKLAKHRDLASRIVQDRPDAMNIADAYIAQGPNKTEQQLVSSVMRLDPDAQRLADDLDLIDKTRKTQEARRSALTLRLVPTYFDTYRALLWDHWGDVVERSLRPHVRRALRRLDGAMDDVGRRLTPGVRAADETAETPNLTVLNAISDETTAFKDAFRAKAIPSEFLYPVVHAYAGRRTLDQTDVTGLLRIVSDWAEDAESTLPQLSDALRAATGEINSVNKGTPDFNKLTPRQIGDVNLSIGVGKGGAFHRINQQENLGGVSKETAEAAAAWTQTFARGARMDPRAAAGRRAVAAHIIRPDLYVAATAAQRDLRSTETPLHVSQPYVEGYKPGGADARALLDGDRADLMAAMDEVVTTTAKEFYVPHAVRDVIARHADAAVNTVRMSNKWGPDFEGFLNWWKQAAILGIGVSNPRQGYLDHMGDLWQILTSQGGGARLAARVAVQSTPVQFVHTWGVAQAMQAADALLSTSVVRRLLDVPPGTKAVEMFDELVGTASGGRKVNDILTKSETVIGKTGKTGAVLYQDAIDAGVIENLVSNQVGRAMQRYTPGATPVGVRAVGMGIRAAGAGFVAGGPWGALAGAVLGAVAGRTRAGRRVALANEDALYDCANVAATRRRLALFVALLEEGHEPEKAGRLATGMVGDFSRELSPLEATTVGRWFPYHAYRKFNMRRIWKALASPWWIDASRDAASYTSDMISAFLDTDDEYGMHSNAMVDEADPIAFKKLYDAITDKYGEQKSPEEVYALTRQVADHGGEMLPAQFLDEDLRADADGKLLPLNKAIVRYQRLKAELDKMPYKAALYRIEQGEDGELNALVDAYWAPDPAKALVPKHLRDRFKVSFDRARSQNMNLYARQGARMSDPEMKTLLSVWPLTPDPNLDGVTFPLLTALSVMSIPAGVVEVGGGSGATQELLAIALRQPGMQAIAELAGLDPETYAQPLPESIGERLFAFLPDTWVRVVQVPDGKVDPTTYKSTFVTKYYLNPNVWAALQLVPPLTYGAVAALKVGRAVDAARGVPLSEKGPHDRVDTLNAYGQFFGQDIATFSESTVSYGMQKDAEERLKARSDSLSGVKALDASGPSLDAPSQEK